MIMADSRELKRVDAHQHFWRYSEEEYGWINDAMATIRRDFLPSDLRPLLDEAGIDETVAVQARQSLEETEWLLELAAEHDWIAGVVGWAPLASADVQAVLEKLGESPKLKGVRHVLQAEPDEYFERADFNAGLAKLVKLGLVYDILVVERQLPAAINLVDCHPDQVFVLDHVAKPRIADGELEPWRANMRELARRQNVACKISGMVTEADLQHWSVDQLRPYVEVALETFGPARLLYGSDWPVCGVCASYQRWVTVVRDFIQELSSDEQSMIMGGNCESIYRLSDTGNSREVANS
jgi:L-fuconolactonase